MIYATGDLHGNSLRFQPQYFPEQAEMTKDDYMIVCGDSGCVWNGDKSDDPQLNRLRLYHLQSCSWTAITKTSML